MGETIDWSLLDASITPDLKLSGVKSNPAALLDAWTQRRHQLVHHGKALKIGSPAAHALTDFRRRDRPHRRCHSGDRQEEAIA